MTAAEQSATAAAHPALCGIGQNGEAVVISVQSMAQFRFLSNEEFESLDWRDKAAYLASANQELELRQVMVRNQMRSFTTTPKRYKWTEQPDDGNKPS